mgnify:CR=1 FL=1
MTDNGRILTPQDVYRLDMNAQYLGVDTLLLMENAGKNVATFVANKFPNRKNVVVVCGLGNNGGDGFVAARHLASSGYNVHVILLGRHELIRTEIARKNWDVLQKMSFSVKITEIKDLLDLHKLENALSQADIVIDAILGVGIRGAARGLSAEAIKLINSVKRKNGYIVISVDVPSGLDIYNGKVYGECIKADYTITFHGFKKGFLPEICGEIIVANIGIPPEAELIVGPGDVFISLKKRYPWSHKGDFGRILVIGGGENFSGAPALAALAALRTGADLVVVAAPESVASIIRSFSPNLIVITLPGDNLNKKSLDVLKGQIERFDSIVLGPGIGLNEETLQVAAELARIIAEKHIPLLIDADGLKAIAKYGIPSGKVVITPHAGEFAILFKEKLSENLLERGELVRNIAKKYEITILLKGHVDVISDGKEVKYNMTGNPGMTVGGTGDVLSGIVAALMAQGAEPFQAACAGAFISGKAGDLALEEKGYELLATDVIEKIPDVIESIREKR